MADELSLLLDVGRCPVSPQGLVKVPRTQRPALRQSEVALRPKGATGTKRSFWGRNAEMRPRPGRGEFSSPGTGRGGGEGTCSEGGFKAQELREGRNAPFSSLPGALSAFLKKGDQISKAGCPPGSQAGVAQATQGEEHGLQTLRALLYNIQPL